MTMKSSDRPSRYSDLSQSEETGDIFRLLDALDHTPSVHRYGRRIAFVLLALLAVGILALSGQLLARRGLLPRPDTATVQRPHRPVAPVAAPAALAAVEAPAAAAGSMATIVYEDSGRVIAPSVNGGAPMQTAVGAAVSAAADAIDEGGGHRETSKPRGGETRGILAATPAQQAVPKHSDKHNDKHTGKHLDKHVDKLAGTRAHAKTRRTRLRVAKRARDGDVDLIAALLSRVSHAEAVRKQRRGPPAGAKASAAVRPVVPKLHEGTVPNRDIVVPRPGEALTSLVQRCRALGMVEGELCRLRICSGNWGKDPACASNSTAAQN